MVPCRHCEAALRDGVMQMVSPALMATMKLEHASKCRDCSRLGGVNHNCQLCRRAIQDRILEEMGEERSAFLSAVARGCGYCGGRGQVPVDFAENRAWKGFVVSHAPESQFRLGDVCAVSPRAFLRATAYMPQWVHYPADALKVPEDCLLYAGTTDEGEEFMLPFHAFEALLFVSEDDVLCVERGGELAPDLRALNGVAPRPRAAMRPPSGVIVEIPIHEAEVDDGAVLASKDVQASYVRLWDVHGSAEPDIDVGDHVIGAVGRAVEFQTDRKYGKLDRQSILAKGETG